MEPSPGPSGAGGSWVRCWGAGWEPAETVADTTCSTENYSPRYAPVSLRRPAVAPGKVYRFRATPVPFYVRARRLETKTLGAPGYREPARQPGCQVRAGS